METEAALIQGRLGLCDSCIMKQAIYTCPACDKKSCSLECVKRHKVDSDCSGKRHVTDFIPIKAFSDKDLANDFNFLEEVSRMVGLSRRDGLPLASEQIAELEARKAKKKPLRKSMLKAEKLQQLCKMQNIHVKLMPSVMKKRKQNKSFYNFTEECVYWTVLWVLPKACHESEERFAMLNHRVSDAQLLVDGFGSFIESRVAKSDELRLSLGKYIDSNPKDIVFFLKNVDSPSNQPTFFELDPNEALSQGLAGRTLIEFPEIWVDIRSQGEELPYTIASAKETLDEEKEACLTQDGSILENLVVSQLASHEEKEVPLIPSLPCVIPQIPADAPLTAYGEMPGIPRIPSAPPTGPYSGRYSMQMHHPYAMLPPQMSSFPPAPYPPRFSDPQYYNHPAYYHTVPPSRPEWRETPRY